MRRLRLVPLHHAHDREEKKNAEFAEVMERGRAKARISVRRAQVQAS